MDTKEQITEKQREIQKCIKVLMLEVKERIGKERERVRTREGKKGIKTYTTTDYQYPIELKLDELPLFALYVHLKKSVYETLLKEAYKNGELEEEDFEALAKVGVVETNGELQTVPLKKFDTGLNQFVDLDLEEFEKYLEEIEISLIYTKFSNEVQAILIKQSVGEMKPDSVFDDSGDFEYDFLEELKNESRWGVIEIETWETDYEDIEPFFVPYAEKIGLLYLEVMSVSSRFEYDDAEKRKKILNTISTDNFKYFCGVLNRVVNALLIPEYGVPNEIVLEILEKTLAGMKRVLLAKKLKKYTLGKDRLFSKGELTKALGKGSEWFSKRVDIYGDKTFTEEELHSALEKLGQPIDLLDFKIS